MLEGPPVEVLKKGALKTAIFAGIFILFSFFCPSPSVKPKSSLL